MARKKGTPRPVTEFGEILRKCLAESSISAADLAGRMGVHKSAISNAMRNTSEIGPDRMLEVFQTLKAPRSLAMDLGMQWLTDRGSGKSKAGGDVPVAFVRYVTRLIRLMPEKAEQLRWMAVTSQWPDIEELYPPPENL